MTSVSPTTASADARQRIRLLRPVALVGMMGCGKSEIGRMLARRVGSVFMDTDEIVERSAGRTVAELFRTRGEAAFRELERAALQEAIGPARSPLVLGTGGGAFAGEENRRRLQRFGVTLWLRADLDVLARRCARSRKRPLLADGDMRQRLQDLLAEREAIYAQADLTVESGDWPRGLTVNRVIEALQGAGAASRPGA